MVAAVLALSSLLLLPAPHPSRHDLRLSSRDLFMLSRPDRSKSYAPRAPIPYERALGDQEPVDVAKVLTLLRKRATLRSAKNFDGADRVLDTLQSMRIRVSDKTRTWYVDGYGGRLSGIFDAPPRAGGMPRPKQTGYTRCAGDDRPVDESRVRSLLAQRFEMRSARDFEGADRLREELRRMGITVSDREMSWKCSGGGRGGRDDAPRFTGGRDGAPRYATPQNQGGRARDVRGREAPSVRSSNNWDEYELEDDGWRSPYEIGGYEWARRGNSPQAKERRPSSGGLREGNDAYARGGNDAYARGAAPRSRVSGGYEASQRRAPAQRGRQQRPVRQAAAPYSRASDCSAALGSDEIAEIAGVVETRLAAKLRKDFGAADALLAELEARGVAVSDDARSWRADGRSFVYRYTQEPGAHRCDAAAAAAEAEALIGTRGQAKQARDYGLADAHLDDLLDLGVVIDDTRRCWRFVELTGEGRTGPGVARRASERAAGRSGAGRAATGGEHDYVRAEDDVAPLDHRLLAEVDALIGRRLAAKRGHRFHVADELQAQLLNLGVEVDDSRREWRVAFDYKSSSWRVRGE